MAAAALDRTSVPVAPTRAGHDLALPERSDLVEALWVARAPHGAPPRVALPDGRPAAVVRLGGAVRWVDPFSGEHEVITSVLRGPRSAPQLLLADDVDAPAWEVGARLAPWALSALHPEGFLVDDHRPLGEALGLGEGVLEARLRACWAPDVDGHVAAERDAAVAAARVLEDALHAAVRRPLPPAHHADLARVVRVADAERGLLRQIDLARSVERSLASLHALFAAYVGVTPSAFLSAVRMSCAVRELGVDDRGDAARVVAVLRSYVDAGYAPREVERFTGLSALDLRRSVRGMEVLLATV